MTRDEFPKGLINIFLQWSLLKSVCVIWYAARGMEGTTICTRRFNLVLPYSCKCAWRERSRGCESCLLTAHWMWWIAHPCPVMCMHIWCWNGLSMGPLSFNHVKAKYRTEHIFCCLALLLCHSLQHNPYTLLLPPCTEIFSILPRLKIANLICF